MAINLDGNDESSFLSGINIGGLLSVQTADLAAFSVGQDIDGSGQNHLGIYYGTDIDATASADIFTSNGDLRIRTDGNGNASTGVIHFLSGFGGNNGTIQFTPNTGAATFGGGVDSGRYFRVTSTDDNFAPYRVTNQAGNQTFDVAAGGNTTWWDFDQDDNLDAYGVQISASASGDNLRGVIQAQAKGGAASGVAIVARRGTSSNVQFFYNGNGTIAGTLTESGSDIKFKTQIRSAPTSQLEDVKNLQLKEWNWTEDAPGNADRNERRNRGLIAQEAELVDPKLVYEANQDEDDSYKAIDHQVLIFKLLGAIQELATQNASLEARLNALKGGTN